MANIVVQVVKPFVLTRQDKVRVEYPVGTHSMPEEDANHWYTQHHIAAPQKARVLPKVDSPLLPGTVIRSEPIKSESEGEVPSKDQGKDKSEGKK
jgi:hypothetical protein